MTGTLALRWQTHPSQLIFSKEFDFITDGCAFRAHPLGLLGQTTIAYAADADSMTTSLATPAMSAPEYAFRELRTDFRERLEFFYAQLRLAPPYHSVEKAIATLSAKVRTLPARDRDGLIADPARRWALYRAAFVESGLSQKHRGIIVGLIRSGKAGVLPIEYQALLDTYISD